MTAGPNGSVGAFRIFGVRGFAAVGCTPGDVARGEAVRWGTGLLSWAGRNVALWLCSGIIFR